MTIGELNAVPGLHNVSGEGSPDVTGSQDSNFDVIHGNLRLPSHGHADNAAICARADSIDLSRRSGIETFSARMIVMSVIPMNPNAALKYDS